MGPTAGNQNLADEVHIYIAPMILGPNGDASISKAMNTLVNYQQLKDVRIDTFGEDIRVYGYL